MRILRQVRFGSTFSLRNVKSGIKDIQPTKPTRTRFAPSPTGFLHLGSLRTALYNYLLARSTGGEFILRLEDTDRKRLVPGAEEGIYETLKWLGLHYDEGPVVGGPSSPYRQSDRTEVYLHHVDTLLRNGNAYRCFCSKERLQSLRDSARALKPPTTVTYDRHCLHNFSAQESDAKALAGENFTVRFKSPDQYPIFTDLLHGQVNLQPQVNHTDRRYDDLVLLKSDNLPTYHLANVVDDHLMQISHVIRGEEWLPSTPKHIALYAAFGWDIPKFIHIPLLTSLEDKKLSKRSGDIDILSLKEKGYLKEALLNFAVLFGWSPKRTQNKSSAEVFELEELESIFNINQLTKGNAKVDFNKLNFLNKHYLTKNLQDETFFSDVVKKVHATIGSNCPEQYVEKVIREVGPSLHTLKELETEQYSYLFVKPNFHTSEAEAFVKDNDMFEVLQVLTKARDLYPLYDLDTIVELLSTEHKKKLIFQSFRFAVSGLIPGFKLPHLLEILGKDEVTQRLGSAVEALL